MSCNTGFEGGTAKVVNSISEGKYYKLKLVLQLFFLLGLEDLNIELN